MNNIRNFSIIAHIDHGKSTLADRILDACKAVSEREKKNQLMDSMDLERERGITIKLNTAKLDYVLDGKKYELNMIDTPGHVDFSYEVSRSLAASEGALLLIDASQGVQAQTLANFFLALENDLEIIPVINKIDLPNADIDKCKKEVINLGFKEEDIVLTSAKTGLGIEDLMKKIITKIPAPKSSSNKLKALIFDSIYDQFQGVVIAVRIMDGVIKLKDEIKFFKSDNTYEVVNLMIKSPEIKQVTCLKSGEVGFISASIKNISDVKIGDTITLKSDPCDEPLKGYVSQRAMVYSGVYPIDSDNFESLREALEKLSLNDASLFFEPETSSALGFGFRCGFLGLLHMDIIKERIIREFGIDIIVTVPSVVYKVHLTNKGVDTIDSPSKMPEQSKISYIEEPFIKASILTPQDYIGDIMDLCVKKRGQYINLSYIDEKMVNIVFNLPLLEVIYDFFDKLKSVTKGYASFDYDLSDYKESKLVKIDILINSEKVDALSFICHKDFAFQRGKEVVDSLKEVIPRTLFEIPIQASINNKVIVRATIKALRKDVLAKCYGGDVTRKKKLLEKQKKGKKKMKQIGSVSLPPEAFLNVLSRN